MSKYQAYPEYKDSGVKWFGSIPKHWNVAGFKKYLASIVDYRGKTPNKTDDGILLVTARNIKKGKLEYSFSKEYISPQDYADVMSRGTPNIGDVLFTTEAPLGEVANVDMTNIALAQRIIKFSGNKKFLDNYYLKYLIMSEEFQQSLNLYSSGSTAQGIKAERFVYLRKLLPPLNEQTQIAAFLDHETAKIDTLIEKQQQLIELLKEKRQAVISHAVTKGLNPQAPMKDSDVEWLGDVPDHWGVINMIHVLNAIGDVDHYMPQSIDKGIPYVMTGDLTELASGINFDNCKQVSHQDYLKLSNKIKSTKGDVIMARYATIGTVSYIDIDKDFLVSYSCVTIKPNQEKVSGLYLYYYFKSHAFLEGIQSQINTNTQGNVGVNDLKKIKVSLPTLKEQLNIVEYLQSAIDKFDALTQKSLSAINLMQERRTALISAAVTGKIDVRNWIAPTTSIDTNEAAQEVTA